MTGWLGWVNVSNVMGWVGLGLNISDLDWVKENRPTTNSEVDRRQIPILHLPPTADRDSVNLINQSVNQSIIKTNIHTEVTSGLQKEKR